MIIFNQSERLKNRHVMIWTFQIGPRFIVA